MSNNAKAPNAGFCWANFCKQVFYGWAAWPSYSYWIVPGTITDLYRDSGAPQPRGKPVTGIKPLSPPASQIKGRALKRPKPHWRDCLATEVPGASCQFPRCDC
jgi:hypothetical protein